MQRPARGRSRRNQSAPRPAPAAVRQTIERELVGARLEDIAMKKSKGKTVYETDIIRDGHKWELVVGEDGQIISQNPGRQRSR